MSAPESSPRVQASTLRPIEPISSETNTTRIPEPALERHILQHEMFEETMDISSSSADEGQIISPYPSSTSNASLEPDQAENEEDGYEPTIVSIGESQDEYEPAIVPSPVGNQRSLSDEDMADDNQDEYEPALEELPVRSPDAPISINSNGDEDEQMDYFSPAEEYSAHEEQGNVGDDYEPPEIGKSPSPSTEEEGEISDSPYKEVDDYDPAEAPIDVDDRVQPEEASVAMERKEPSHEEDRLPEPELERSSEHHSPISHESTVNITEEPPQAMDLDTNVHEVSYPILIER